MSILSIPFSASKACPQGYIASECWQCRVGIFVRERTSDTPTCQSCRRALIDGEFGRIKGDVLDIINGKGEWEFSTPSERNRFLSELRAICFKMVPPVELPAMDIVVAAELQKCREFTQHVTKLVDDYVATVPAAADVDAMLATEEMEPATAPDAFEQW